MHVITSDRTVTLKGNDLDLADLKELVHQAVLRGMPDTSRVRLLTGMRIAVTAPLEAPDPMEETESAAAGVEPRHKEPDRCPWCGSTDPELRNSIPAPGGHEAMCSHSFHEPWLAT